MKDKTKVELKKELEAAKLRISELEAFKKKYTQTEHALKVSEEKLIVQYKSIPVPTYTWQKIDEDFVLVDHNDAAVTITQGKIADYIGKKATEMYRENPEIIEEFSRCFHEKVTINREMPYKFRYSGEEKYLAVKYAFVPPDLVMVHTEDITERKQKEVRSQV